MPAVRWLETLRATLSARRLRMACPPVKVSVMNWTALRGLVRLNSETYSHVVDQAERLALIVLLVLLAYRLVPHLADKPLTFIYLISETVVVVMIACRRSTSQISLRPADWVYGFGGTFLPLMVAASGSAGFRAGRLLLLLGFVITVGAQLSLCRSFGIVAANRGVKTSGLYGVVRHPMYMGYFLTHVGFLLMNPTVWNAAVYAAWAGCQVRRIDAEERILSADVAYMAFARRVPYRLVPFVY